jgi:hypothetical protein
MSVEHSREEDPIEQLLLTAYPNPERKGCPGHEVLAQLANKERDPKDDVWYHVWHCSPCYAEFKGMRDARWGSEEHHARIVKRRAWLAAAAGIVLVAGAGSLVWRNYENTNHAGVQMASITLDLSEADAQRGADRHHNVTLPAVPRAHDTFKIILPKFSDDGEYSVAILKSESSNVAVALGHASTTRSGDRLTLSVSMDLSNAAAGQYLLATRWGNADQIYFYPLRVR